MTCASQFHGKFGIVLSHFANWNGIIYGGLFCYALLSRLITSTQKHFMLKLVMYVISKDFAHEAKVLSNSYCSTTQDIINFDSKKSKLSANFMYM